MPLFFEDLETGQHYYDDHSGEVYEVVENHVKSDPETGALEGALHLRFAGSDEVLEFDVDELTAIGYPDEFYPVSDRVAENPEAIINEFAKKELRSYLDTLSVRHEYNGIDCVDTLSDIVAARMISDAAGGSA